MRSIFLPSKYFAMFDAYIPCMYNRSIQFITRINGCRGRLWLFGATFGILLSPSF